MQSSHHVSSSIWFKFMKLPPAFLIGCNVYSTVKAKTLKRTENDNIIDRITETEYSLKYETFSTVRSFEYILQYCSVHV